MRYAILLQSAFFICSLSASPFEPEPGVECVVYSEATSDRPLHVEQWTTNGTAARRWEFPASYSGHRSVCRLPGASTNGSFVAWFGGDQYEPGDMFGVSSTHYGYYDGNDGISNNSNYSFEAVSRWPVISTKRQSPICPRIKIWGDTSDRGESRIGATYREYGNTGAMSGMNVQLPAIMGDHVRVRVSRYAVNGYFTYSIGALNRVVFDKVLTRSSHACLTEADFIGDGEFDIDWATMKDEVRVNVSSHILMTNLTYLVVIGDGPTGFSSRNMTNESETVTALGTVITRRFDVNWASPKAIGLKEGAVLRSARRPTFVWSMPEESDYAKRFGSSYTAFRIQILDRDKQKLVITTDVIPAPPQDEEERFVWQLPNAVGDESPLGQRLASGTNFQWIVAMYNAKFKPMYNRNDAWSNIADFSVAVDAQNETED